MQKQMPAWSLVIWSLPFLFYTFPFISKSNRLGKLCNGTEMKGGSGLTMYQITSLHTRLLPTPHHSEWCE